MRSLFQKTKSIVDLSIVLVLSSLICFWKLGFSSFGPGDETLHVLATQSILHSGQWWLPTVDGAPYFGKPPFKMWLSLLPVWLLGESNFSYRFVDALAGVGTCLVLFYFAKALFSSRLAGFSTVILLLSCRAYTLNHGPRMAVQDSLLLFLFCGAMLAAWKFWQSKEPDGDRAIRWAIVGAVLVAFSVLTKSVAGYVPLLIVAAFALFGGEFKTLWISRSKGVAIVLILSLIIPAPYFIYHSIYSPGGFEALIGMGVFERALTGFENTTKPWFYLERIFADSVAVPPVLLLISTVAALVAVARYKDQRYLFLLCWLLVPLILFSIAKSKLTWYITPTFPAMALLIAGVISSAYAALRERKRVILLSAFLGTSTILVGYHFAVVTKTIFLTNKNHPISIDLVSRQVLADLKNSPDAESLILYRRLPLPRQERTYLNMLSQHARQLNSETQLKKAMASKDVSFIMARLAHLKELSELKAPLSYASLPAIHQRSYPMVILSYKDQVSGSPFVSVKRTINFGDPNLLTLHGIGKPHALDGSTQVRWSYGSNAALALEGDRVLGRLGAELTLNIASDSPEVSNTPVKILFNGTQVAELTPTPNILSSYSFFVPRLLWQPGKNVLSLVSDDQPKERLKLARRSHLLNSLEIELGSGLLS